jgi:hypothetical protein
MHSLAEKDGGNQEHPGPAPSQRKRAHRVELVISRVLAKQRTEIRRSGAGPSDPDSDPNDGHWH